MRKAPEAFRTISEAADALDTPAHVLRFWESKFTQVKPVKRAGGRRYYRPADIDLLAGIKLLLHEQGMTIRGVQKLLQDKGAKHVAALAPLDAEMLEGSVLREVAPPPPEDAEPTTEPATPISVDLAASRLDATPAKTAPEPALRAVPQPEETQPDMAPTPEPVPDLEPDSAVANTIVTVENAPTDILRFSRVAHALRTDPPSNAADYAATLDKLEALVQRMAARAG